jgi:hypothetical protein
MEVSDAFWDKWTAADEIEKVKLVATLSIVTSNTVPPFLKHSTAVFVNSYLMDLYGYTLRKGSKDVPSNSG